MIINLDNTSGLIQKRVQLGRNKYNLIIVFNHTDEYWYISIAGHIQGIRVTKNRTLFKTRDGQLKATGAIDKENFKTLEWINA